MGDCMRIAICDDERDYVYDIERHINQYFSEHGLTYELDKYYNSKEIIDSHNEYDIAFLDIEMDGENGINVGKALQMYNPDIVLIFITAYEHYLDEALDLGTTRFFDKPIDSHRFYSGLERAINKVDNTEIKLYLKDDNEGTATVKSNDIIYVEITGRKTKIVTKEKEYLSKDSMKTWKNRLTKSYFVSPHNSFIVNTNYITYFQKDHIILSDQYNIPIAYAKRVEFKRKFMMLMEG